MVDRLRRIPLACRKAQALLCWEKQNFVYYSILAVAVLIPYLLVIAAVAAPLAVVYGTIAGLWGINGTLIGVGLWILLLIRYRGDFWWMITAKYRSWQ